jgi:hypothetical protein
MSAQNGAPPLPGCHGLHGSHACGYGGLDLNIIVTETKQTGCNAEDAVVGEVRA